MTERVVTIYGASDDLIEVEDTAGILSEEYDIYSSSGPTEWFATLTDTVKNETVLVHVAYGDNGVWSATLSIPEEGSPFPDWVFESKLAHPYAVGLTITGMPETVTLTVKEK